MGECSTDSLTPLWILIVSICIVIIGMCTSCFLGSRRAEQDYNHEVWAEERAKHPKPVGAGKHAVVPTESTMVTVQTADDVKAAEPEDAANIGPEDKAKGTKTSRSTAVSDEAIAVAVVSGDRAGAETNVEAVGAGQVTAPSTENEANSACDFASCSKTPWQKLSCLERLQKRALSVWAHKDIYTAPGLHILDTTSDFASACEFWIVAGATTADDCGGLDVTKLLGVSLLAMALYRVTSAVQLYRIGQAINPGGGWIGRVLSQLADVQIYYILYISHKAGLKGSSSPQRQLAILEAVFESAAQAVAQATYLLYSRSGSPVVVLSTAFSFLSLTLTVGMDDFAVIMNGVYDIFGNEHGGKFSVRSFVVLLLYRLVDVPTKLVLYSLMWYGDQGIITAVALGMNTFVGIASYFWMKNDGTESLVAMVVTLWTATSGLMDDDYAFALSIIAAVSVTLFPVHSLHRHPPPSTAIHRQ